MPSKTSPRVDPDEYLTPAEAAVVVKLTARTLADLRWRGGGPPFRKLGPGPKARVRYRRGDLDDWMQQRDG
jgi:hypothetical protein